MSEPQQPYGPPPGQPGYGPPVPAEHESAEHGSTGHGSTGHGPAWGVAPRPAHQGPTETEPKAVVALVLAVLAWTPVVPFVGAIAALVLARYAERDIDRAGGARTGRGLVKASRVLGWTHLVFCALLLVVLLLFVLLPLGFSLSS